jgi:thiol-disulfide isomerase/thioredoxin
MLKPVALAAAFLVCAPAQAANVGKPAPQFTVTTFAKQKVTLDELRGKVVVLNYWATWCGPCKAEMPMMDSFHRRYKDKGFEIFAVTTEGSVPQFRLKKLDSQLSFPLASKIKGKGYGTIGDAVPTSYMIDRKGMLRYAKAGAFSEDEFRKLILPLLAEPAS